MHRYALFLGLAVIGCWLDLYTKHLAFELLGLPGARPTPYWIIQGFFGFETSVNQGALFGLGQGMSGLFAILSVGFALVIVYWLFFRRGAEDLLLTIAMGCVTAGIFGNLYDRLGWWHGPDVAASFRNGVRDWILFEFRGLPWPNFNLADSFLVCGAALLMWHAFHGEAAEKANKSKPKTSAPSTSSAP